MGVETSWSPAAATGRNRTSALALWQVLSAIGGIYIVQSVVGGLTFIAVPTLMRANGVALDTIGLVSFLMVPWAIKFLWAPAVERYRLPTAGNRRTHHVVLFGQTIAAAGLIVLALTGADGSALFFAALILVAVASASVDIGCDAFAIEQLSPKDRGWGNTAQIGGGYTGMAIGGGLFLYLVGQWGWLPGIVFLFALLILLTVPFAATAEPTPKPAKTRDQHRPSLRFALNRRAVWFGLIVVVLVQIGPRLAQGLVGPFLVDQGVDIGTIGILNGIGGIAVGLFGTAVGGLGVRYLGSWKSLALFVALQAIVLAGLAIAAHYGPSPFSVLASLGLAKTALMAATFVALYSLLMGLSSLKQAGVDFTLFQSADALIAAFAGFSGASVAQELGYAMCFGLASGLCLLAGAIFAIRPFSGDRSDQEGLDQ